MKFRWKRFTALAATVATALALLVSCSKPQPPAALVAAKASTSTDVKSQATVLVSAAASTKDVMESLAKKFSEQVGDDVKINPGPSNGLANQILSGAPADLFLSANEQWAEEVKKGDLAEATTRLLTNHLVIVVPKDNPGGVHQPADLLSNKIKKIALAGENVPAGIYAGQALTKLDLFQKLTDEGKIVRGQDVRGALSFVERGEAEAGIVYSSDVLASTGVVTAHEFDPKLHDEIVYVLVLLKHGADVPAAREFYEFLQSPAADEAYKKFGFTRLPAGSGE